MIEVRGLKKSIHNGTNLVEILRGIDLTIPEGQFAAIMGASGSGKSTLLGLLAGLDAPTEGEVILDGTPISRLNEDELAEIRGKKLGFVFQSYQLIPMLTALENVLLPFELNGSGSGRDACDRTAGKRGAGGPVRSLSGAALRWRAAARCLGACLHAGAADCAGG